MENIKGISTEKTNNFLGIIYAHANRFEKPVIVNSPIKSIDATKFGDCCPQSRTYIKEDPNAMYFREFREGLEFTYSEDCLSLNIYSPKNASNGSNIPVLIYIHGGNFIKGSSAERPFDGTNLASKGLIVVTINYRLNIFGSYMGKNLMLYDMKAAIDWVYDNITEFGGDKENITLSGQSAGAMSVQALSLVPEVQKKIKRAIMISGGACTTGIYAPKNICFAKSFYKDVDKLLKSKKLDSKTCSAEELYMAFAAVSKKRPLSAMAFSTFPAIDNELIKKSVLKKAYKFMNMDAIYTITKDDLSPRSILVKHANKFAKKSNRNINIIYFDKDLPGDEKGNDEYKKGAFHSSDLWYFFGNLNQHTWRKFDKRDFEISEEIMNLTVSFCKGNKLNISNNYSLL